EDNHRVCQTDTVSAFLLQTSQRGDGSGDDLGTKLPYSIHPTGMEDSCEIILDEAGVEYCCSELAAGGGMEAQRGRTVSQRVAEVRGPTAEFLPVYARNSVKRFLDRPQTDDWRRHDQAGAFQRLPIGASPPGRQQNSPEAVQTEITTPAA